MELQQYSSHLSRSSTLVSSLSSVIKIEIATPRRTRQNKQKTEQIIFPSHIIYLTDGSKKIEKTGKIFARPPIFHSFCARPSSAHLLIWSCHRLANRDLQPLETNDPAREGQQLTAPGCNTTLRMGFTLWYRSGFETFGHSCFQKNPSNDWRQVQFCSDKSW